MIKPSVSRRVWYWPTEKQLFEGVLHQDDPQQALDAGVLFVHDDRKVNLFITDHWGRTLFLKGVQLLQEGDPIPVEGGYAQWMPYQVQAADAAKAKPTGFNPDAGKASPPTAPLNKGK